MFLDLNPTKERKCRNKMDCHAKQVRLNTMVGRDGSTKLVFHVCSRAPPRVHLTRCPNSMVAIFSSLNLVSIMIYPEFHWWKLHQKQQMSMINPWRKCK